MSTILRKKSRTIVRDSKSDALFYVICYAIVAILCLIVLYPLIYILSASFSSPAQVSSGRVWLFPVEPTLYSYSLILQYKNVFIGYGNTIFYTVVGTMINVALTMIEYAVGDDSSGRHQRIQHDCRQNIYSEQYSE